jgi:hypothetical protein
LIFNYAISRHAHLGVKSARKLAKERELEEKKAKALADQAAQIAAERDAQRRADAEAR